MIRQFEKFSFFFPPSREMPVVFPKEGQWFSWSTEYALWKIYCVPVWWMLYISLEFSHSLRPVLGYVPTANGPAALLAHRGRGSLSCHPQTGFMERVIHWGKQGTLLSSRPGGGDHGHWEPSDLGESQRGLASPVYDCLPRWHSLWSALVLPFACLVEGELWPLLVCPAIHLTFQLEGLLSLPALWTACHSCLGSPCSCQL